MTVRLFGSILLTLTLIYAFTVVLPAYAHGVYYLSDFRAKGFYDVPPLWMSNHPLKLMLSVIPTLLGIIPWGHFILVAFLSFGMGFPLMLDWQSFPYGERLLWLLVLISSWLFFYVSFGIIEVYRIWLLD